MFLMIFNLIMNQNSLLYKFYINAFDYHVWYPLIENLDNVPKDVIIIEISQELKNILLDYMITKLSMIMIFFIVPNQHNYDIYRLLIIKK